MKNIGIIGAMEEEVAQLKERMQGTKEEQKAGMTFVTGTLEGLRVTVVRSGIGKVNAGICGEILAEVYQVEALINTGIAGSLSQEIHVCDMVVSTDALQHDMDATGFGYRRGEIPQSECSIFPADEKLQKLALEACEKELTTEKGVLGRIASGDQFISSKEKKQWLVEEFQAQCCEMEGAAIAQVAFLNHIPYVILRAISDEADEKANLTYEAFEAKAILNTRKVVLAMLSALGKE